jgi:tellurite resistance protein
MLVDGVLRGVFGGRRKRSKRAVRYLTGSSRSLLNNPTALWTAAGLAWGVIETLQNQGAQGSTGSAGVAGSGAGLGAHGSPAPLPPLPNTAGPGVVPNEVLRLVRLAISAANADGAMSDQERAAIARQAEASGGSELLAAELSQPRPVAEIVSGVTDPAQRATLYVLAYTILRADEQVSGAERIYLARLAHLLGLSPDDVQRLEKDTSQRIDAQEGDK